jgi:phosphoribosylformylglycinamidine synthase
MSRHRILGLTDDEYAMICDELGRSPNDLELALYGVMWSEHCSYKSSRIHLRRLPTEGASVLVGPGENAGVIDVGDGIAIALRIESHNHPSFIEPYQGAATGVGGILRDIFTMGARPIALMDPLFVGPIEDPHSRYILDGIVRGIAGYGNSVGVPTVGGQITFDATYRSNPLVNVFCLGVLEIEHLVLGQASGVGNLAVLLGSNTGRDGIGGVSVLASVGFGDGNGKGDEQKRPSVQVADPYEEKRLIEACLELITAELVVGVQDLGGAGLACASSESAARAHLGMDLNVDAVRRREPNMTPIEVMTSESQERMLAIVAPENLDRVEEVCRRWEVNVAVVGRVCPVDDDGIGRLRIRSRDTNEILAELPASSLTDGAPLYNRAMAPPLDFASRQEDDPTTLAAPIDCGADLCGLLSDPSWIYRQYDHQLFLNTVFGPGEADASVLLLASPEIPWRGKALALSVDANPGWCAIDPREGTAATVAESILNLACVGAFPLGIVNCLNFGNPEHDVVMWELSEAIDGMAEACRAFSIPVVGGNVSLYNESGGGDIEPTPCIGAVGLIERLTRRPPAIFWREGDAIVMLGPRSSALGGSQWARSARNFRRGALVGVDFALHANLCEAVRKLVAQKCAGVDGEVGCVRGIHDISAGGVGVALAEFALSSRIGCCIDAISSHGEFFSESPSRVVIATPNPDELLSSVKVRGIDGVLLGVAGGDRFIVEGLCEISVEDLAVARSQRLEAALDGTLSS